MVVPEGRFMGGEKDGLRRVSQTDGANNRPGRLSFRAAKSGGEAEAKNDREGKRL